METPSGRRKTHSPRLELLEDRTLLATMIWTNAAGGDWDVTGDWVNSDNPSDHHVPTSFDGAQISVADVPVTHASGSSDSVNSLSIASGARM